MFTFFDYLFYKAGRYYYKRGEQSGYRFSSLIIVCAAQAFNLFSIYFVVCVIIHDKPSFSKYYGAIPMIALLIVNGIRYNKNKYCYDALEERWGKEEESKRMLRGSLLIGYIILSTALCFGLAAYLGSKKW